HLQLGADIPAHVDIGYIDGQYLKCSAGIKAFFEYCPGYQVRILEHVFMRLGTADGGYDALAHPGYDSCFACTSYEPFEVRPDSDTRLDEQFYTVLRHCRYVRRFDHLGVDTHFHGFQYIPACKIDGGGPGERKIHVGPVGGDQGIYHLVHVPACQVVRFQLFDADIKPGFPRLYQRQYDLAGDYSPEPHPDKGEYAYAHTGCKCRYPEPDRDKVEKDHQENDDYEYDSYRYQ